ncbi:hypothetical protein KP509_14G013300 [Ceratopteris richardii]|uniref:Uncharacterized protein n=1 Tax=Ceratopteris richardii TaxID=49495 RepID=A0A8T2T9L1_CERRI|nr:hypothetical protein KP509_14G013300 [Ceratopteris richardii]
MTISSVCSLVKGGGPCNRGACKRPIIYRAVVKSWQHSNISNNFLNDICQYARCKSGGLTKVGMLCPEESTSGSKKRGKLKSSLIAQKDCAAHSYGDCSPEALQEWNCVNKKRRVTHQDIEKRRDEIAELEKLLSSKLANCDLESGSVTLKDKSTEAGTKENIMENRSEGTKKDELNKESTNWIQKASWTSLVGETGRFEFSLSSMLDNKGIILPELNHNASDATAFQQSSQICINEDLNIQPAGADFSESLVCNSKSNGSVADKRLTKLSISDMHSPLKVETQHENATELHEAKQQDSTQGRIDGSTFVRSENYEEEWWEAKRAVKEILKRSRKDALKSVKMFHTRFKM